MREGEDGVEARRIPTAAANESQPRQRLVSIKEATAIAGVSRRTIYNWIALGRLTYVRTAGGTIRIAPDSLFRKGN